MVNELKYLFPNAELGVDIVLQDDGKGAYIKEWNVEETKPTDDEINAVTVVANQEALALIITAKANQIIYTKYPQTAQNKLQSQGLKLTLKLAKGGTLTADEVLLEESILVADTWITAVRTIENTAIADGTLLDKIDWTV